MLDLKADNILNEIEKFKNSIENISFKSINDEVNSCLNKGNVKKLKDDKEELLEMLYNKTIKNYLQYMEKSSINEAEKIFKKELEENKNNIKSLLIKSDNEINEYKKKYLNSVTKNKNLQEKIYSLQNYNRDLLKQIQLYQLNLEKLQKNYENISRQKTLFEELIQAYPGKNPSEVIKELHNMKDGIVQMMNDYQNISMKLYETKENQKNLEDEYKISLQKLSFENKIIKEEKNAIDFKYNDRINNLEQHISDNEAKIKENQYLKNVLFHIYNLLFKEFALNRNINIDKKFLDIKESDFNANLFYDNEIKNYINLMIKTINPITYDIMFRETMGYLNMILRIYLPNKMNLRFQPVKAFKEIKEFIDLKMEIIDNNHKLIEKYKNDIEKKENELFQMKQEINALNKEYNLYKNIVEKEFEKTNRIIFQLKTNKENNNKDNNTINKTLNKKIIENEKLQFNNTETNFNNSKYKLKDNPFNYKIKKKKSNSINSKFLSDNYIVKNKKNNKTEIFNSHKICKTLEGNNKYKDFLNIRKSANKDRIIKENGNQEIIDKYNNIRFLVNETNRLFLYQPKMNSTQEKLNPKDKHNIFKTRVIRDYKDLNFKEGENIKKKILKQLDNLIISSNK